MASSTGQDDRLCNELARTLRTAGFGKLAKGHPWQPDVDPVPGLLLVVATTVGNVAGLRAVGAPWPLAILGGIVAAIAWLGFVEGDVSESVVLAIYLAPAIAAAVAVAVTAGWTVLLTNVLPFAACAAAALIADRFEPMSPRRTLDAVKSVLKDVPLLFPLVALVLFALILTSEIWKVANSESEVRLATIAIFVILPVTWQLHRTLVDEIKPVFEKTAATTIATPDAVAAVALALHADTESRALTDEERRRVRKAFEDTDAATLDALACERLLTTFRRRVLRRLVLTVVLVGVAAFVLILGLTWLTIAGEVAAGWAGEEATPVDIPYWTPFGLLVPLGPYLKVSALLATLAVAVFLAFVITNKDLFERFQTGYIERPAATALLLAVPYVAERKRLDEAAKTRQEPLVSA